MIQCKTIFLLSLLSSIMIQGDGSVGMVYENADEDEEMDSLDKYVSHVRGGTGNDALSMKNNSGKRELSFWGAIGDWFTGCPAGNAGDNCSAGCTCRSPNTCEAWHHVCRAPGREGDSCHATRPCGSGFTCEAGAHVCRAPGTVGDSCHLTRPCGGGLSCQPGVHRCYHSPRWEGEPCSVGYGCGNGLTCDAGTQICRAPGNVGDTCHLTRPCGSGLTCEAGTQICRAPGNVGDTCHATRPCGSGLTCKAGSHVCRAPGDVGDPCHATRPCGGGLSCQPGVHKCYHSPRRYEEPCSLGFGCGDGLSCHPGIHKCYHSPRLPGEPCSAGYGCGTEGFSCAAVAHKCLPDEIDLDSDLACATLKDDTLSALAIESGGTYSYGTGAEGNVGVLVAEEVGTVYGGNGEFGCYVSVCVGGQTDISGAVYANMGIFNSFDVFAGESFVVGAGVETPIVEVGFGTAQVFAIPEIGEVGDHIGVVNSFSFGFGILPVGASGAYCYTEVLEATEESLNQLKQLKDDARRHAEDMYDEANRI